MISINLPPKIKLIKETRRGLGQARNTQERALGLPPNQVRDREGVVGRTPREKDSNNQVEAKGEKGQVGGDVFSYSLISEPKILPKTQANCIKLMGLFQIKFLNRMQEEIELDSVKEKV